LARQIDEINLPELKAEEYPPLEIVEPGPLEIAEPKLPIDLHERSLEFTISGIPVSGSQLKFNRKTGNAYRPTEHKQRVYEVYEFACRAVPEQLRPMYRKGTPIAIGVTFYFPYRSGDYGTGKNEGILKPNAPVYVIGNKDLDNMLKPLKDGMKGVVYNDDKQIVKYLDITKLYSESPRTVVRVQELI
jgi:Holliday junction resolvase RusA-like endonuclease